MKVILELSPRALKFLQQKAKESGRSRKKYMELVLTIHAAMKEVPTPSQIEKSKSKNVS